MHKALPLAAAAIAILIVLSPAAASACTRAPVAGAQATLQPGQINQTLLDASIASEVNFQRCRLGLRPLGKAPALQRTASEHASWMARKAKLSHKSTRPGRATVKARILSSGLKVRRGSENIAKVALYKVEEAGGYRIVNASACQFASRSGAPIPRHTYGSLSRYVVGLWMKSPHHRVNIVDRKVSIAGTAAAIDPRGRNCGSIYLAQNFAG
ncbi:CAP domain-containing protein [Vannielia sp.]|uniref:CAP domain-containing protein n=1 Tax=Vannielia sp. TaxID=2813045 RepID=UPI0026071A6A|nr:CAP domain-containing protein [Vannielia sp.]MDF1872314.1 CAP domain-containing protein [Vannielia sp.]